MSTHYTDPQRDRSHDPLRVLTVDPGARSGWAMWDAGTLDACGWVDGKDTRAVAQLMQRCQPELLVIERPFVGKANLPSVRGMWLAFARWATIAEYMAIPIEEVWPASWQTYLPGWRRGMKRPQVEELYTQLATGFVGRLGMVADECAAVCIGWWYWGVRGIAPSTSSLADLERER